MRLLKKLVLTNIDNEVKLFSSYDEVRRFLLVGMPRIRYAIKTYTVLKGWKIALEDGEEMENYNQDKYILYNKLLDKEKRFTSLKKMSEYTKKTVTYLNKVLKDLVKNVIFEIDEIFGA